MINLLPPDAKRELRAARSNTLLFRYNFFLAGAIGFLFIAVVVVYFYLDSTRANAETVIQENTTKVAGFSDIQQQADEFRKNLATAKQILDKEVSYSEVTIKLASLMPPGTILDTLSLDSTTFGTPMTLSASARSYADALALKNSFSKSDMFSDVHFESISGGSNTSYPINVSLNVTIKKEAATL